MRRGVAIHGFVVCSVVCFVVLFCRFVLLFALLFVLLFVLFCCSFCFVYPSMPVGHLAFRLRGYNGIAVCHLVTQG